MIYGYLEYWLEYYGMPKENIDHCATQIAQGYGACRYLDGVRDGADAVNELIKCTSREESNRVEEKKRRERMLDNFNKIK